MSSATFHVIVSSPSWSLSGANTFSANLVRGLNRNGVSARLLLTIPQRVDQGFMPIPSDLQVDELSVSPQADWLTRWKTLIRYLERLRPCIYIPNYDWDCSGVSPRLSRHVGIVGIVHSDEPIHYEHVERLGRYWNATVCVSQAIKKHVIAQNPSLADRTLTISHGVQVPDQWPERSFTTARPLKIIYTGRLVQYQKRVFDLPEIVQALRTRGIPATLTIAGSGTDMEALRERSQSLLKENAIHFLGTVENEKIVQQLAQHDVFILTSNFEGLPVSLLESMGRGCIPVVTDISSGIPEVLKDGVNGYRIPVGHIQEFTECLAALYDDPDQRRMLSKNAHRTIYEGGYRTEDMAQKYQALFEQVIDEARAGIFRRPHGKMLPPPHLVPYLRRSWKSRLPMPIRKLGHYGKNLGGQLYAKMKIVGKH